MKSFLIVSTLVTLIFASAATATESRTIDLDSQALQALTAVGHVPADFAELMRHGNKITDATVMTKGMSQTFSITVKQCMTSLRVACLGGATLTIEKTPRNTRPITWQYEATLAILR